MTAKVDAVDAGWEPLECSMRAIAAAWLGVRSHGHDSNDIALVGDSACVESDRIRIQQLKYRQFAVGVGVRFFFFPPNCRHKSIQASPLPRIHGEASKDEKGSCGG